MGEQVAAGLYKKKAGRQLLYIDTDISEWDVKSLREKMC